MSTKVYVAYKLKDPADLWNFIRSAREEGVREAQKVLTNLYLEFFDSIDETSETFISALEKENGDVYQAKKWMIQHVLSDEYKKQATSPHRNPFNFDVSITFRELNGQIYLIPYCDWTMKDVLNFLSSHPMLEHFQYWNNVEPPKDVEEQTWRARGKVWHQLGTPIKEWDNYLALEIVSQTNFFTIDPWWDLLRAGTLRGVETGDQNE